MSPAAGVNVKREIAVALIKQRIGLFGIVSPVIRKCRYRQIVLGYHEFDGAADNILGLNLPANFGRDSLNKVGDIRRGRLRRYDGAAEQVGDLRKAQRIEDIQTAAAVYPRIRRNFADCRRTAVTFDHYPADAQTECLLHKRQCGGDIRIVRNPRPFPDEFAAAVLTYLSGGGEPVKDIRLKRGVYRAVFKSGRKVAFIVYSAASDGSGGFDAFGTVGIECEFRSLNGLNGIVVNAVSVVSYEIPAEPRVIFAGGIR